VRIASGGRRLALITSIHLTLADTRKAIAAQGLSYRGAFHKGANDAEIGADIRTLMLVGFTGRDNWPSFAASPEAADGKPNALDRWSRRVIGTIAATFGATALFPFDGPPWLPFQRWAQRAEPVHPSPTGMLIHPDWGLWHSWRGALAFREWFDLPPPDRRPSPCESCATKPCLTACPVNAFSSRGYDVAACVAHLDSTEGADCRVHGCRARRACPVGSEHRYTPAQAHFHLQAFRNAQH
jgi:hypothetical protein